MAKHSRAVPHDELHAAAASKQSAKAIGMTKGDAKRKLASVEAAETRKGERALSKKHKG